MQSYFRSNARSFDPKLCPTLPGSVTECDTVEEARTMPQDATRACSKGLSMEREPIPGDRRPALRLVKIYDGEPALS